MDKLSTLFQDFYVLASSRIATHIDTLSSRQHRRASPSRSASSRSSSVTKANGRQGPAGGKDKTTSDRSLAEQQMLTASEIEDRRKARKQLERTRLTLEEAVERRVCEAVYSRTWRHRSTQDEERDEKLRSRTAALSVVGVGLLELGIDLGNASDSGNSTSSEEHIREWLSGARKSLMKMNDEKYPLGKLIHLKAAHKSIVDTLSHFHPSSSSADEILPTLIYTLITTPTEGINVISNLYFIQRFRSASKVDGEAAYCLTNLEAAITFLENVDLASLKPDELQLPPTPKHEKSNPLSPGFPPSPGLAAVSTTLATATSSSSSLEHLKSLPSVPRPSTPSTPLHQRRLSHLLQPPTSALGAAGDAVITTADQGLKTIGNTLESSYKFLFGRLREREVNVSREGGNAREIVLPKTLDEARRLVGTPPPAETADDKNPGDAGTGILVHQPQSEGPDAAVTIINDKPSGSVGGQKLVRDRSPDSGKSGTGGKLVASERESSPAIIRASNVPSTASPLGSSAAVESMRTLGNTLNPLNRLAGMGVIRSFGRSAASVQAAVAKEQGSVEGSRTPVEAELKGVADLTTVSEYRYLAILILSM
jgi:Vacuolar sorting protein 9 (VPS9) domain